MLRVKPELIAAWLLSFAALAFCRPALANETIGSPLIPRQVADTDAGEVYLYDGLTSRSTATARQHELPCRPCRSLPRH